MDIDQCGAELHELFGGRLKLYQPAGGYRFSIDALLLAAFAQKRCAGAVADLGTGCGVLPVLLARHTEITRILGVEIQKELAELARRNIQLNGLQGKVTVLHGDLRAIKKMAAPESFDAVVSNPPFYPASAGRINPGAQKAVARHELHGTLEDFAAAAACLLKQGGRFCAVYNAARLVDLLAVLRTNGIEPKSLRFVHARSDEAATMVLAAGIKGAGAEMLIEPPLVVYETDGIYAAETRSLFETL